MNTRRRFINVSAAFLISTFILGCKRHRYVRQNEQKGVELDLGPVKTLLFNQVHVPIKSVFVTRDLDGWKAMSTRCTYEGCDLSINFEQQMMHCPCCKSEFTIEGIPYTDSKASDPLPYMEIFYKEGHLYARADKAVDKSYKFVDKKIEDAIRKLKLHVRDQKIKDGAEIPAPLLGTKDSDEESLMFLDHAPKLAE